MRRGKRGAEGPCVASRGRTRAALRVLGLCLRVAAARSVGTLDPPMREDVPAERPTIWCVIARPGKWPWREPRHTACVDLLDLHFYEALGWQFVCRDPFSYDEWVRWRAANPDAA